MLDDYAYLLGRIGTPPDFPPGGGFWAETVQLVQVAQPDDDARRRAQENGPSERPPQRVRNLRVEVGMDVLEAANLDGAGAWNVILGVGSNELEPAGVEVFTAEHMFITGPPRSGRSTALLLVAAQLDRFRVPYVVIASNRSPFHGTSRGFGVFAEDELESALVKLPTGSGCALLIDDCEGVSDVDSKLTDLLLDRTKNFRAFVAGSPDRLRRDSMHWSRNVRISRTGLLLNPGENDSMLLEVQIPKNNPVPVGQTRGWLVQNGTLAQVVQLANPELDVTPEDDS